MNLKTFMLGKCPLDYSCSRKKFVPRFGLDLDAEAAYHEDPLRVVDR